ncbi:MAG: hybrid sensor histidine kinase/response regulator [Paludibacteraceae bacterium]
MIKKISILLIFFCLVATACMYSQEASSHSQYYFEHFNIDNGLSQNTVHCILQDRQGFMWFGTKDGLNRFDGKSFKVFKFSQNKVLKDNVFRNIIQDKDDNIWVGTDDGLFIYNPHNEVFKQFDIRKNGTSPISGVISDLTVDGEGDVWFSVEEKGVYCYFTKQDKMIYYPIHTTPGDLKGITLLVGKGDIIWVAPYSLPLLKINKRQQKIERFNSVSNSFFYETGEVGVMQKGPHDDIFIGTSQKGLLAVNTHDNTVKIVLDKDENGVNIFVRDMIWVDNNTLWIGTESGVYIYNTINQKFINLRHHNSVQHSLSDNAVYSLYKDREGGMWVGSYFGGIDYSSDQFNLFEKYYPMENLNSIHGSRVREFCEAPDGNIWIGTEDNGINLFDPKRNTFLPVDEPLKRLYNNIHALYADGDNLWIGTFSKGLNKYNLKTKSLKTFLKSNNSSSISENSVFSLCKDRMNQLWVGTLSGLNIYNYSTDNFTRMRELEGVFVYDILEDVDGNMWFATFNKGVYRYNPEKKKWTHFLHSDENKNSLPFNKVTSIYEDNDKNLWFTTEGAGFCMLDKSKNTFTTFDSKLGLSNDVVYQMIQDDDNNFWLSTNLGLSKFNFTNRTFKNYTVHEGLNSNQFNYKSSFKTDDGTLYFGTIKGFVRFNPNKIVLKSAIPPIVLTDFYINNHRVDAGKKSPLKQSIQYTDELKLSYWQRSFGMRFAILNYSESLDRVYYRLKGFDREWIPANIKEAINYSNLNPGKYELQIIITNEARDFSSLLSSKSISINIRPPFWLSIWAYAFYVILAVATLLLLIRNYNRKIENKQRRSMELFEQKKERELYVSKIDFFTNVAHEIRTPLSLIKAPLDHVLSIENIPNNLKDNLEIMSKNTDRLLNLTNQLLDFRKTESNAYKLNFVLCNVKELVNDTYIRFTPLADQRNISFEEILPDADLYAYVDKEGLTKIISNLLNNAIKYSGSFVKIKLKSSENENNNLRSEFYITTENDGVTIPEHLIEEAFKPFVQLDNNGRRKKVNGTGIGLALARSLAELHQGTLEYEDVNAVNCFRLVMPIGNVGAANSKEEPEVSGENPDDLCFSRDLISKVPAILLVEDDHELIHFLEKYFSPNYTVYKASDGEEALKLLRRKYVNIIISDVMMPNMDGFELCKQLKSSLEYSHIPILLLTAKVNVQSKIQGLEIGADAYIEKPFSIEVLQAQVSSILHNRSKLHEAFKKYPYIDAKSFSISKADEDFLKKLNNVIQNNLSNPEFNNDELAEIFNMSRASFYRKIKGILDFTPNEYIRVERLKKAALLLREKDAKINEVCYTVGFSSPSYFSKCFQKQFGVLPKDFE